mgnify:CR=1 FL=1
MKDKLKTIINHYGINAQQRKFAEEVFELEEIIVKTEQIKILNKAFSNDEIAEEVADCMVMLNQFKEYYNITDEQINNNIEYKVNRQLERIKKEGEKDENN